ncbi:hypothetical protein TGPRC2_240490 [Toxoplasma gondii TgCatPRC2]|uniref:Uncharacterized protein n=15 Tax=Toxoplasma gondii TaxID=5811 RepID=B9PNA4_TOXGV|nr:hypothetical protein TGME49_240490 [Toxoplasma gondii ME49]EPR60546.1 hypothetical protein TGGT1_240490 [Toxoplasma gondii GT1]ESS31448.1 hypothetical protein TGVEG_240490 [Toxoplasma gondii VEG]KAF4643400.1 hypothetical protein TGRH88_030660 [Toxoplasma gondii]KFG38807.1 hypothetical protein TGP89_240490 [Toxoplasma gondii p89]KFG39404.1 hypothetical protein TGDOM2_240490 [Toxoplasma gondii GAB2-2007-GAL-DOM2]KFG48655.1 hypothetical protein TGFOU_240490 [Toxoplasma gondii FOU]KFG59756.1 |eukprot:XP_018637617.1 hypothetical protein TGME49_240490 [Toxoplasma gondii ME49]
MAKMGTDCASDVAVSNVDEQKYSSSAPGSSGTAADDDVTGGKSRCPRQAWESPTLPRERLCNSVVPDFPESRGAVVWKNNVLKSSFRDDDFFKVRMQNGDHVHLLTQFTRSVSANNNDDDAVVVLDDPGEDLSRLIREFSNQA